ncbi:MAG: hypothetical protein IT183_14245 [Acidobacteria bacterium]|nr:hypothetical protein [Acidobacteriota bacterium]
MGAVIQHDDRGPIGRVRVRVVGAAAAVSVPLPTFSGYLIAAQTAPDDPTAGRFDVRLKSQHGLDMFDSCGLRRDLSRPQRFVVRLGSSDTHPVCVSDDSLTLEVRGLPPGCAVEISIYYGRGER